MKIVKKNNMENVFQKILQDNTILVLDGDSFEFLMDHFKENEEIVEEILNKVRVYGRTNPI